MGFLSVAGHTVSALGSVASGVCNVVGGLAGGAGKIAKSLTGSFLGKAALAAGVVGILASNPKDKDGGLLGKFFGGFKSLITSVKDTVVAKLGNTAVKGAAVVSGLGNGVNEAIEAANSAPKTGTTLGEAVISNTPFYTEPDGPAQAQEAPGAQEQAEEPAPEPELA